MLANHNAYKYETPYKFTFVITQCFTNVTVNLQCGLTKIRYNIRQIKPYKSDTHVHLIVPYIIKRKVKKENLHLKSITPIDPVTGWFEITQYDD